MEVFGDTTLNTVGRWLNGLSGRQRSIADNIANIDTPGYQRREVPFEAELRRAVVAGGQRLAITDSRHMPIATTRGNGNGLQAVQQFNSNRLDGNNVDIDQEMVTLAETQLRFQAAASALNSRLAQVRNVIQST